jgi:hypothetical protein
MKKLRHLFLIGGFYIWFGFVLFPLSLIIEMIGYVKFSEILISYIYPSIFAIISISIILMKKIDFIDKLEDNLPKLKNFFIYVGWIPYIKYLIYLILQTVSLLHLDASLHNAAKQTYDCFNNISPYLFALMLCYAIMITKGHSIFVKILQILLILFIMCVMILSNITLGAGNT